MGATKRSMFGGAPQDPLVVSVVSLVILLTEVSNITWEVKGKLRQDARHYEGISFVLSNKRIIS